MNTFNTPTTVNRQEAEALKEMIFNRVRARAEAMSQDVQNSCVDNFQNELMDLARSSFTTTKNPFATNSEPAQTEPIVETEPETVTLEKSDKKYDNFGFATQQASYIVSQIKLNTTTKNEEITRSAISSTMDDAQKSLQNKSTFMGALNFLNSQASIAIVNKTGKRFEANA